MIQWNDISGRKDIFFEGHIDPEEKISWSQSLHVLFEFLKEKILGKGNALDFDLIVLHYRSDSGRLTLCAATKVNWAKRQGDGCSLRVIELEEYSFNISEQNSGTGVYDEMINAKALEIGEYFLDMLIDCLEDLTLISSSSGFDFHFIDPEEVIFTRSFEEIVQMKEILKNQIHM